MSKDIEKFKADAVATFGRTNYLQRGTTITWKGARRATWRDGSKGFSGEFTVSHPSHKTVHCVATQDADGIMVR